MEILKAIQLGTVIGLSFLGGSIEERLKSEPVTKPKERDICIYYRYHEGNLKDKYMTNVTNDLPRDGYTYIKIEGR